MTRELPRGSVVLAPDPYNGKSGRRPFVIISGENYPFYPAGYLGVPVTSQDKSNTYQIHEHDMENINEELYINPSYVNPWSPCQVNNAGRKLMELSDDFMDILAGNVAKAIGGDV